MTDKNKKCNKVVKTEIIKIPKRNIKVEYKNLHGNCQYAGQWEDEKSLVTVGTKYSPEETELILNEEHFHAAISTFQRAIGCGGCPKSLPVLCRLSNALDNDPFLGLVMREYDIGIEWSPYGLRQRFWDFLWHRGVGIMRYIASMRLDFVKR